MGKRKSEGGPDAADNPPLTMLVVGCSASGKSILAQAWINAGKSRRDAGFVLNKDRAVPFTWPSWVKPLEGPEEIDRLKNCVVVIDDIVNAPPSMIPPLRSLVNIRARHSRIDTLLCAHGFFKTPLWELLTYLRYISFTRAASNRKNVAAVAGLVGRREEILELWDPWIKKGDFGYLTVNMKSGECFFEDGPTAVCQRVFAESENREPPATAQDDEEDDDAAAHDAARARVAEFAALKSDQHKKECLLLFDVALPRPEAGRHVDEDLIVKLGAGSKKIAVNLYDVLNSVLDRGSGTPTRNVKIAFSSLLAGKRCLPQTIVHNKMLRKLLKKP